MNAPEDGEQPDGCGGRDAAVNYKTRKRPTVYTITGGGGGCGDRRPCACCTPSVVPFRNNGQPQQQQQQQQQRRRPRTWTCGGGGGGGGGGSSLTRSRTFTSNYERAISSLLWQPYECRSSSNSLEDDGDVAVWLDSAGRYEPLSSRSSLSLSSTVPRSCASSVCRLLDDSGDKTPPPCWCTAADDDDPNNETTTTGYRCPPRGSLLQRRGTADGRSSRSRTVQSNVNRPWSRVVVVPSSRRVSDWCCDNEEDSYCCVYDDEVRDDDNHRPVPMNDGNGPADAKTPAVQRHACTAERTYASTEAQTDETACSSAYREQRRRERRERRQQQRRVHPPPPPPPQPAVSSSSSPPPLLSATLDAAAAAAVDARPDRLLPDLLLNSHLPPPVYATVGACDVAMAARAANLQASLLPAAFQHPHQPPGTASPVGANPPAGFRLPFGIIPARRRRSLHYCSEEDTPKSCCGLLTLPDATSTVSIRWFIGIVFIAGICSALVGTVLGATRASGREHLTVALLMIGVGVILVAISGIAWRLTAGQEASSCGAVFGLGRSLDDAAEANRRFVPRLPPSYGRPHHPYAAMMYPEFEYRAPPPSYQASMQEYRLRLLLLDRQTNMPPPVTASPPPTYRSQPGTLIRGQNVCCRGDAGELYLYHQPSALLNHQQHQQTAAAAAAADYSGPPSYRSRTGTLRPGCHLMMDAAAMMQMGTAAIVGGGGHDRHSRDPSRLSASEAVGGCAMPGADDDCGKVPPTDDATADGGGVVVTVDGGDVAAVVVDEKTADRQRIGCGRPVTVVRTAPADPPPGTVVVTVSAAANDDHVAAAAAAAVNVRRRENEMEILAHL